MTVSLVRKRPVDADGAVAGADMGTFFVGGTDKSLELTRVSNARKVYYVLTK